MPFWLDSKMCGWQKATELMNPVCTPENWLWYILRDLCSVNLLQQKHTHAEEQEGDLAWGKIYKDQELHILQLHRQ